MMEPDELQELQESEQPAEGSVYRVEQESIDETSAWDLRPALLRALYVQGPKLWVDLSRVSFIDSTGLGMLVGVLKEAREMNGDVRLMNAGREVRRILQVTGLEALFEMGAGQLGPAATGSAPLA
jgi:anti-sigma B factor antagonist